MYSPALPNHLSRFSVLPFLTSVSKDRYLLFLNIFR